MPKQKYKNDSSPTRRVYKIKNQKRTANSIINILKEAFIKFVANKVFIFIFAVACGVLGLSKVAEILGLPKVPDLSDLFTKDIQVTEKPVETPMDIHNYTPCMPNLIGMSYDKVVSHFFDYNKNIINARNIIFKQKVIYSTSFNKDKVVKQNIPADTVLNTGDKYKIILIVGKGEPIVPNYTNKKLKQAKKDLRKMLLKCKVKKAYSNSVKKGYIIKQSIHKGKSVAPRTTIELTVSRGRFPSTAPTPHTVPSPNTLPVPQKKSAPTKIRPTLEPVKIPDETLEPVPIDE